VQLVGEDGTTKIAHIGVRDEVLTIDLHERRIGLDEVDISRNRPCGRCGGYVVICSDQAAGQHSRSLVVWPITGA